MYKYMYFIILILNPNWSSCALFDALWSQESHPMTHNLKVHLKTYLQVTIERVFLNWLNLLSVSHHCFSVPLWNIVHTFINVCKIMFVNSNLIKNNFIFLFFSLSFFLLFKQMSDSAPTGTAEGYSGKKQK